MRNPAFEKELTNAHREARTQHGLGKAVLALAHVVDKLKQCQSLDLFGLGVGRIVAFEIKNE